MEKIRIAGIIKESIVDGPGLRTAIFAQGCSHQCEDCHNPNTWDPKGGQLVTVERVLEEIKKVKLIDGVTLSGGEPFEQAEGFAKLAQESKKLGLLVLTFTGYTFEEIIREQDAKGAWRVLLENSDLLIDGPYKIEYKDLSLSYRGSSNQRIIDVTGSLKNNRIVLYTK